MEADIMVSVKAVKRGFESRNDAPHNVLRIGPFAKQAGVSIRTVRYYEELGLIRPENRSRGGFRMYGPESARRLSVINFLKGVGLPLTEIRRILLAKQVFGSDKAAVEHLVALLSEKLRLVESKIVALHTIKTELAKTMEVLQSCRQCGNQALLEASSCCGCARLGPEEKVPDTLWALLH